MGGELTASVPISRFRRMEEVGADQRMIHFGYSLPLDRACGVER
jgi:hypothetical protein